MCQSDQTWETKGGQINLGRKCAIGGKCAMLDRPKICGPEESAIRRVKIDGRTCLQGRITRVCRPMDIPVGHDLTQPQI